MIKNGYVPKIVTVRYTFHYFIVYSIQGIVLNIKLKKCLNYPFF